MTKPASDKGPAKDEAQPAQAVEQQPKTAAVVHTDNSKNGYLAARRAARENGVKK